MGREISNDEMAGAGKPPRHGLGGSGWRRTEWFDNDRLRRAFMPWMWPPPTVSRSDAPQTLQLPLRHDHPFTYARKNKDPLFNFRKSRSGPTDFPLPRYGRRAGFMARLEVRIRREIRTALYYRRTEMAVRHMWRFLAHPFESWRNRLWRMAYLHEGLGQIDEALAVYECMVREYRLQGDVKNAEMFLREMVHAAPDRPCYRRRLAETYLDLGWRRHAVREFGWLEQHYWQQGNVEAAELMASIIADQASEPLQKRSVTGEPKIWEPGDTFCFGDVFENEDDD